MRILLFVSVLGILVSIAVLIAVIMKSNKGAETPEAGRKDGAQKR